MNKRIDKQTDNKGIDEFNLGNLKGTTARVVALKGFYHFGWVLFQQENNLNDSQQTTKEQVISCLQKEGGSLEQNADALFSFWHKAGVEKSFHLSFWPYVVACKLRDDWQNNAENTWRFLSSATRKLPYASRLHHPDWQEPILLLSTLMDKGQLNNLIDRLLYKQGNEERYLRQNLRLVAAIIGEVEDGSLEKEHEEKITEQLGRLARNYSNLDPIPQIFITTLSSVGKAAIPELEKTFELYRQSEEELSIQVIKALGEIGSEKAVPFLSDIMDERWGKQNIKLAAADALGKIDNEAATRALIRGIEKDEFIALQGNPRWREAIPPFINSSTAVPPLIHALQNSHEDGVQRLAAITLGEIGDRRAIPSLVSALDEEDSDFVSEPAANALINIGKDSIPYLHTALNTKSNSNSVRYRIALILVDLGDFREIHHLAPYLKERSTGGICRDTIQKVLVQIGKVKGKQAIYQYLQICKLNPYDRSTRIAFLETLKRLNLDATILDLMDIVDSSSIQYFLLEALAELRVKLSDIEHELIRTANNDAWHGKWQSVRIIEILGEIGSVAAIPNLLDILNNNQHILAEITENPTDSEYIRALAENFITWFIEEAAIESLGKIKADDAVTNLTHIITFDDKKVYDAINMAFKGRDNIKTSVYFNNLRDLRKAAAIALKEIGNTTILNSICNALGKEDITGRVDAANALGIIGDVKAVPHLINILTTANSPYSSQEAEIYKATATSLGLIGDVRAVPHLIYLLGNSICPDVQDAAVKALKQIEVDITEEEVIQLLIGALETEEWKVYQIATEKLTQMGNSVVLLLCEASRNSNNQQLRYQILRILGEIGDRGAIPILVEALNSSDESVSHTSVQALTKIGNVGEDGFGKLVKLFNDKEKSFLHEETAVALGQLAASVLDEDMLESARKALWQRRYDNYKENIFIAYEKVVTQLTIIQARKLSQLGENI